MAFVFAGRGWTHGLFFERKEERKHDVGSNAGTEKMALYPIVCEINVTLSVTFGFSC